MNSNIKHFIMGSVFTYLVWRNAIGLSLGRYSHVLLLGLPEYGVSDDWTRRHVIDLIASTAHWHHSISSCSRHNNKLLTLVGMS